MTVIYHPLSSEANTKDALRQIDSSFRDIVNELQSLQKQIKDLQN